MQDGINRRTFLGFVGGGVLLSAAGCHLSPGGERTSEGIRFSSYGNPDKLEIRSAVVDAFIEANPEASVSFEGSPTADYWDRLSTQMSAGNAPDVINIDAPRIGQYAGRDALLPLTDFIPDVIRTDEFDARLLGTGSVNDVQYGVPVAVATQCICYNLERITELGMTLPDGTWDFARYAEYATAVSDAANREFAGCADESGAMGFLQAWIRARGDQVYAESGGGLGFDVSAIEEFFEYWDVLRRGGGCESPEGAAQYQSGDWPNSAMAQNRAVMQVVSTPVFTGGFQAFTDYQLALTLIPRAAGGGAYPHFSEASSFLSLNAKTSEPDLAAQFLEFFVNSRDAALALRFVSGPPASAAARAVLLDEGDLAPEELELLEFSDEALAVASPPPSAAPAGDNEVRSVLYRASQAVAFGQESISSAAATFYEEAERALESA